MSKIVYISGTPCTGKTTITNRLSTVFDNIYCIHINEFAIENNLVLGKDPDKGYKIIDIDKLNEKLNEHITTKLNYYNLIVVEGHLSHLCDGCDKCIILRLNPSILKERLKDRNYSESKINENLEAEILDVCSIEAYNIHSDKVNEIDTSNKSIDEVLSLVEKIILDKIDFPVGNISFIDYLLD